MARAIRRPDGSTTVEPYTKPDYTVTPTDGELDATVAALDSLSVWEEATIRWAASRLGLTLAQARDELMPHYRAAHRRQNQ